MLIRQAFINNPLPQHWGDCLHSASGNAALTQGKQELGRFLMSPLLMALSKATTPDPANPLSATLLRPGHWRLLRAAVSEELAPPTATTPDTAPASAAASPAPACGRREAGRRGRRTSQWMPCGVPSGFRSPARFRPHLGFGP